MEVLNESSIFQSSVDASLHARDTQVTLMLPVRRIDPNHQGGESAQPSGTPLTQAENRLGLYSALRAFITMSCRFKWHPTFAVAVTLTSLSSQPPCSYSGPMVWTFIAFSASKRVILFFDDPLDWEGESAVPLVPEPEPDRGVAGRRSCEPCEDMVINGRVPPTAGIHP